MKLLACLLLSGCAIQSDILPKRQRAVSAPDIDYLTPNQDLPKLVEQE